MKKIFTLLILFQVIVVAVSAQDLPENYYTENFESQENFDLWTVENISGNVSWILNSGLGYGDINSAYEGNLNACFYSYNYNEDETMLISPAIDLSDAQNPVLKFRHVQPVWSSDQDELKVYYKVSAESQWVLLSEFSENINDWTEEVVVLPDASSDYYIAFSAKSGYGYGVGIDNLSITSGSFCSEPKGISFVNVKETSALIRWQQAGNVSFEAEYGISGFVPGTGTRISNISDAFLQINGLEPWVEYDFYLRAYCSEGVSGWSYPLSFITDCEIGQVLPYTESFENNENPIECWQVLYANYDYPADNQVIVDNSVAYSGQNSLRFSSYAVGSPYDQYLISPSLNVAPNTEISFKYRTLSGSDESFAVGFSTDPVNPLSSVTWEATTTNADETWREYRTIVPENSKYVVIHYQSVYEYYLYVDDIRFGFPVDCNAAQNLTVQDSGTDYALLSWENTGNIIAVEYGEHGFIKNSGNAVYNFTDSSCLIGNLDSFTQYDAYVVTDCEGIRVYSEVISFFTDGICENITEISATQITKSSAVINWTISDYHTQFNVEFGLSGFEQGNGTILSTNIQEVTLASLIENTEYDVYVQAVCNEFNGVSDWTEKYTFITMADSINDNNPSDSVPDVHIENPANTEMIISVAAVNQQNYVCDYDNEYHFVDLYILNEGTLIIPAGTEIKYTINFLNKSMFQNESITLDYNLSPGEKYPFSTTKGFVFDDEQNFVRVTLSDDFKKIRNHTVTVNYIRITQDIIFNNSDKNSFNVKEFPFSVTADVNTNADLYEINSNYLWSTGETTDEITLNEEGSFSFTVSNEYCTRTEIVSVKKLPVESTENNTYNIYPNPSEGQITIENGNAFVPVSFDVYDSAGRKVYSSVISAATQTIDLSSLASGIYNVAFTENESVVLKRLFIE